MSHGSRRTGVGFLIFLIAKKRGDRLYVRGQCRRLYKMKRDVNGNKRKKYRVQKIR
jgi:hypothetical protein